MISADTGSKIKITFNNIDIESPLGGSCYDYVQVYDGSVKNDKSLGKFCGRNIPRILKSQGNTMLIRFYSDDRTPKVGFRLTWKAIKRDTTGNLTLRIIFFGNLCPTVHTNQ